MREHVNRIAILEQFVRHKTCCSTADLSISKKGILKYNLNAQARSIETKTKNKKLTASAIKV
jgi:hypothetical protein